MSEPTEQEKAEKKGRMRTALDVLERYVGSDGKINATELTKDAVRARQLERELDDTKELLRNVAHAPRGGLAADWWSVAIEQRRKRIAAEKECDALRAELAAAKESISDLYEVVRAFAHVAQHGPHDPSPLDENSPLMDAVRDVLAKVGA